MEKRYDNYLKNYTFFTNSIEFRILSSKSLERWKNIQSFQLNQMVHGKFEFSSKEREIILLSYDLWSKCLYEIENMCIEISGDDSHHLTTLENVDFISNLLMLTESKFVDVTNQNKNFFDEELTAVWLEQHQSLQHIILSSLKNFIGVNVAELFDGCVSLISEMMLHELTTIHELNAIMGGEKCIPIVINGFQSSKFETSNSCIVCNRLKVYLKHFKIDSVFLKNMTESPLTQDLSARIGNLGISINYMLSSRFE